MPTYDYRCPSCGSETSVTQTISEYVRDPIRPYCPDTGCSFKMERKLSVSPGMSGLANALAGDRHYQGLAYSDGTPIDSRTKHRQFMKDRGFTVMDDFKETWKKNEQDRVLKRLGQKPDLDLKREVTEQVMKAVAKPD